MKKLLILLLTALIFVSISAFSIIEEWEKVKDICSDVRKFLQKYGIFDDIIKLLTRGAKIPAQRLCVSTLSLPPDVCSNIVDVVAKLTSNIHIC